MLFVDKYLEGTAADHIMAIQIGREVVVGGEDDGGMSAY